MLRFLPVVLLLTSPLAVAEAIVIGSKNFTENYILAEASAQLLESHGYEVRRRFGLNGTKIVFEALQNRALDFYPEYTGTITEVILERPGLTQLTEIRTALAQDDLILLSPLGFNNSYAIAVSETFAKTHQLRNISDLTRVGHVRVGLPHEFLSRNDGWPGLKQRYAIDLVATGIEHSLSYEAIASGKIDVTAVYSTDGEILRSRLVLLHDDLSYFPQYRAAFLARQDIAPPVRDILESLSGRIDDTRMQQLNLQVLDPAVSFADVASEFLLEEGLISSAQDVPGFMPRLWRNTQRHLKLTGIALLLAIVTGVGIAAAVHRSRRTANAFLYFTGLLQTVPSIALLALLIPWFGIGQTPAIIALFLYSLLPIARGTITAMLAIPPGYRHVAAAMAMSRQQEMRYVLMPLAMPHVIAGIRTAAVISIGTATLAAFIGAGGLGDPIVTGLALNDSSMILQGALPAAGLAILTELAFTGLESWLVVPHMRGRHARR
ncbi:MAG: ABC transporter permease subunit [Gammaproteobacteria bacterium]|nr:ABC transporter permease subunit [Gammaproteobacteria bacterium]MDH4315070.1 ABC transporter permease subunit [Gammaproteobacteria bacterium]MDH5214493.1 ABC transporter permease subunit [Gammaproteobacteria bacterium]MDH5500321.1 ABC transporter permease subunit [Gammaproteobacteria bacterium]